MNPTITDQQVYERDYTTSPEVVVICRREDGSIAIHHWGNTLDEASILALQAFRFSIEALLRTGKSVSNWTWDKPVFSAQTYKEPVEQSS